MWLVSLITEQQTASTDNMNVYMGIFFIPLTAVFSNIVTFNQLQYGQRGTQSPSICNNSLCLLQSIIMSILNDTATPLCTDFFCSLEHLWSSSAFCLQDHLADRQTIHITYITYMLTLASQISCHFRRQCSKCTALIYREGPPAGKHELQCLEPWVDAVVH